MNHRSNRSVLRIILIGILLLVLAGGGVLYYLYMSDTPFTAYVDGKIAQHYEDKGDYANAIRYYEKIHTEDSLSHIARYYEGQKDYENTVKYYEMAGADRFRSELDAQYCAYGKLLLEEKNYLKGLKMYESASVIPVLEVTRLRKEILSEDFMKAVYEGIKDPALAEDELPPYLPVLINKDNFSEYIYYTETYEPNLSTRTVTVWDFYLNSPYAKAFDAESPLNYLDLTYCFEEGCYGVKNHEIVEDIWHWDVAYKYQNSPHPSLKIRKFTDPGSGGFYRYNIEFTGYAWDDDYWDPNYYGIPENIWIDEAEGLLFFNTDLFR